MYRTAVVTKEQAIAHLFFHCCFRDEVATESETTTIADKVVKLKLHKELDLKEEVKKYKAYQPQIGSDQEFLGYLASLLPVQNKMALYSYCVELCLTDLVIQPEEERLLAAIAVVFDIPEADAQLITNLMLQRLAVESGKLF